MGGKRSEKEGDKGDASQVAPLSPLERTLSQAKLESSNNAQRVDSSVDSKETSAQPKRYPLFSKEAALCHAANAARNDDKNATILKTPQVDSRENAKNVSKQLQDSRICKNAQNVSDSQAAGFCDDFLKKPARLTPCTAIAGFVGCRAQSKGAYLAYVTAALRDDSRKSAQKPTPKPNQAQFSSQAKDSMSVFGYATNGSLKLICYLSDEPKDRAKELIEYLQSNGKQVVLLSGDRAGAVESVARSLGIGEFHSGLLPAQKARYIQDLQESLSIHRGKGLWREDPSVVMIGDGLNDIIALKNADVGISMGAGSDIAIAQSDVIVLDDSLASLQAGFAIARETYARIYQNLAISLGYNALLIPLALCGFVIPLVAALSMSLSSLLVVGNSLRKGSSKGGATL